MVNEYWKNRLERRAQAAYESMLSEFSRYREEVVCRNVMAEDVKQAYRALMADHPELFHISFSVHFPKMSHFGEIRVCARQRNIYGVKEINERKRKIEEIKRELLGAASGLNTFLDKEKLVCDRLVANTTYAIDNLYNQNASEVLINGKGQCSGISKAAKMMLGWLGIPALVLDGYGSNSKGDGGPHTWCIVENNGVFHHLDVTYMLGANPSKQKPYNYRWFNCSDAEVAPDHDWDKRSVPRCVGGEKPAALPDGDMTVINSMYELRQQLKAALEGEREFTFFSAIPAPSQQALMNAVRTCCRDALSSAAKSFNISISIQGKTVKLNW